MKDTFGWLWKFSVAKQAEAQLSPYREYEYRYLAMNSQEKVVCYWLSVPEEGQEHPSSYPEARLEDE